MKNCLRCSRKIKLGHYNRSYCSNYFKATCEVCNNRYLVKDGCKYVAGHERNNIPYFCSKECSQKYKRKPVEYEKICATCGDKFIANKPHAMFCKKTFYSKCSYPNCEEIRLLKTPCKEGKTETTPIYCKKHIAREASKIQKEKSKKRNLELYGVEYYVQSEDFKEKVKKTNLEKYGYECNLSAPEIREKIKKTNLEKYGNENAGGSKIIQEKIKNLMLEKYGSEYYFQTEEFKERSIQTNLEKYGVRNHAQREEVRQKMKSTMLKKYGTDNINTLYSIRKKINQTLLDANNINAVNNFDEWYHLEKTLKKKPNKDIHYWINYFNISLNTFRRTIVVILSGD